MVKPTAVRPPKKPHKKTVKKTEEGGLRGHIWFVYQPKMIYGTMSVLGKEIEEMYVCLNNKKHILTYIDETHICVCVRVILHVFQANK